VFALETYCPASDGYSAARLEEEVVLTDDGPVVITLFPSQDLVIANAYSDSASTTGPSTAATPQASSTPSASCSRPATGRPNTNRQGGRSRPRR
jgi:hypothetical protein